MTLTCTSHPPLIVTISRTIPCKPADYLLIRGFFSNNFILMIVGLLTSSISLRCLEEQNPDSPFHREAIIWYQPVIHFIRHLGEIIPRFLLNFEFIHKLFESILNSHCEREFLAESKVVFGIVKTSKDHKYAAYFFLNSGESEWFSGHQLRLPPLWPGFNPSLGSAEFQ